MAPHGGEINYEKEEIKTFFSSYLERVLNENTYI